MSDHTATARGRQSSLHSSSGFTSILARVRSEYDEMPGLCLTRAQAQRLLGLDPHTCDEAIGELVEAGYLKATPRGFRRS